MFLGRYATAKEAIEDPFFYLDDEEILEDYDLENDPDLDVKHTNVEPDINGIGLERLLSLAENDSYVIRDANISDLRAEIKGCTTDERKFIMEKRKALRNRESAKKCMYQRQAHIIALQHRCTLLERENKKLKALIKS